MRGAPLRCPYLYIIKKNKFVSCFFLLTNLLYEVKGMSKVIPAFKENNIPIVFTSSAYYAPYLAVSMKSVIDTANPNYNYDIIVLHKEISAKTMEKMQEMKNAENISIRFVEVDTKIAHYKYNYRAGYSPESFYRVVMVDVLEEYDKTIYLDCDVIVRESISKLLLENDVADCYVAAARDIDGIASCCCHDIERRNYMHDFIGLSRLEDYFQSGVMVFNLKKIRGDFTLQQIIDVSCHPQVMFGDQDVLNTLFHNKVCYLDMAWNTIIYVNRNHFKRMLLLAPIEIVEAYSNARKKPYIIHYAGEKPWITPDTDMAEEYWKVARSVSFYEEIIGRWQEEEG